MFRVKLVMPRLGGEIEIESTDQSFVETHLDELTKKFFLATGVQRSRSYPTLDSNDNTESMLTTRSFDIGEKKETMEEFVRRAKPHNGTEYLIVAGYFLEKMEKRSSFTTADIVSAFLKLKFKHSNPSQAIAGARSLGFLMGAADGSKGLQLSRTGEEKVEAMITAV